jgi:hypothetical protein
MSVFNIIEEDFDDHQGFTSRLEQDIFEIEAAKK